MVVVFMVVLNLLLMLLLMVVLMLLMVWGHVLTVAPLGCHVAPMIPLVMHIMVGEPRGRGSHGGRSSNTHNYTLSMTVLTRTREHDTVTRVGGLGGADDDPHRLHCGSHECVPQEGQGEVSPERGAASWGHQPSSILPRSSQPVVLNSCWVELT